jgi:hypothetical protein
MKTIMSICFAVVVCFAQSATIDIDSYKKSKSHAYSEKSYTVGKHVFRVVNIKPLKQPRATSVGVSQGSSSGVTSGETDTACISAIILDKRKYVLFDIGVTAGPLGMVVPAGQPIAGGLIVLKASPYEGKTFLMLPDGKLVTLPGSSVIVDTADRCVYCVWDNDKNFKLTVFDYKGLRLIINTTEIVEPRQWYSDAMGYCFTGADAKAWYTVDFMTKSIIKGDLRPDGELRPVSYFGGLDKIDRAKCCGAEVLKK